MQAGCHEKPPRLWCTIVAAGVGVLLPVTLAVGVTAQTPVTTNGLPPQVIPQVSELGMPNFTVPNGTIYPFGGTDPGMGDGSDSNTAGGGGIGDTGTAGNVGSSDALSTMMQQSWGTQAINESQSLGVNPTAIAATCAVESGCQNITNASGSSATGPFQMMPSTFNAMYAAALQEDPSLASTTTGSINDPASQAAASAEYLKQGARSIQNMGVSNPTVLDVRGFYNFGPSGAALATAGDNETMSQVMPNVSQSVLSVNGITAGETVGQWKASVAAKIGNAANQTVLNS
jgi:hypothetical protein